MSAAPREKAGWLGQNYEKLILMVVLVVLLVSALLLVLRITMARKALSDAKWEKPDIAPKSVQPVELSEFEPQLERLKNPPQAGTFTNALMASELRVTCISCGKPIVYRAELCPFCAIPQPAVVPEDERDTDKDGLPNMFE